MRKAAFGVLALLAGAACASHPATTATPSGASASQQSSAPARDRDVITQAELSAPSVANLTVLEAVRSLRPQFLTVRGMNTVPAKENNDGINGRVLTDQESGKVHASIDGNKIVALEELAGIRAGTVVEVRYLSPAAAMQRFGGNSRQGPVILVKTM